MPYARTRNAKHGGNLKNRRILRLRNKTKNLDQVIDLQ